MEKFDFQKITLKPVNKVKEPADDKAVKENKDVKENKAVKTEVATSVKSEVKLVNYEDQKSVSKFNRFGEKTLQKQRQAIPLQKRRKKSSLLH